MRVALRSDGRSDITNNIALIDDALLRDYFAAQAIACFQLNDAEVDLLLNGVQPQHEVVARFCYGLADAMMAERSKQ